MLNLEWKSEWVMDDESGESMDLMEEVPLKELGEADSLARFGDRWDLVRKSEVFIEYEAEVTSRVSGGEWGVVDFGKLFT